MKKISNQDAYEASKIVDAYIKQSKKVIRNPGLKYILCQHLREKTQTAEATTRWIGETTRLVMCPVCSNENMGLYARLMQQVVKVANEPTPEEIEAQEYKDDGVMDFIRKVFKIK